MGRWQQSHTHTSFCRKPAGTEQGALINSRSKILYALHRSPTSFDPPAIAATRNIATAGAPFWHPFQSVLGGDGTFPILPSHWILLRCLECHRGAGKACCGTIIIGCMPNCEPCGEAYKPPIIPAIIIAGCIGCMPSNAPLLGKLMLMAEELDR